MSIKVPFVTGIVLAAGTSSRLGQPKQLLPYRGGTLLAATLAVARACGFDQLLVTLGGGGEAVRASIDLADAEVVVNPEFAAGCGSSLSAAMTRIDSRTDGVVLLLGDQPGVQVHTVRSVIAGCDPAGAGVRRYREGLGHPLWFGRATFASLAELHGDKAIWKLLHSGRFPVTEYPAGESIPLDVDTAGDYDALLQAESTAGSVAE